MGLTLNSPGAAHRTSIIHALTRVGIVAYVAWTLWLFQVLYRTTQVSGQRFSGVWEQRLETLAFIGFLPNLPALAVPAAAAATATWLAGPTQELGLAILLRLIRWTANGLVVIGILGVLATIFGQSGGFDEIETIAFRASGAVGAVALSVLCLEAGRTAPGG